MGCTQCRGNRVQPIGGAGPEEEEGVNPVIPPPPLEPTLDYEAEVLNEFDRQRDLALKEDNEMVRIGEVHAVIMTEDETRNDLHRQESTERGYFFFELEEQYEQAKLVDDLEKGVIAPDHFVMHHEEDHKWYYPPFLPRPTIEDVKEETEEELKEKAEEQAKLAEEMMNEFDEEPDGGGGVQEIVAGKISPDDADDDGSFGDEWAPHRKKRKKREGAQGDSSISSQQSDVR